MGVARVNGLAVSRAFGNAEHKNMGGLCDSQSRF